jgi:hypothetical protein
VEELRLEDVDAFLALDGPADSRPREGVRIDFKENIPDWLGEIVAAYANTYGGLVVLGVAEVQGIPQKRDGLHPKGRGDLKTQIANLICSTVQPRPRFEIGVVPVDASDLTQVAVIRVEDGDYPPYMFTRGGANKIPIRVADKNQLADLRTIEALFGRRDLTDGLLGRQRPLPGDELYVLDHEGEKTHRSSTQLRLWVRPHRPLRLRLDDAFERKVMRLLARATNQPTGTVTRRRGDHFQATFVANPEVNYEHAWRVGSDGSVGFATQILASTGDRIFLQDIVDDVLRFCSACISLLSELEYPGRVDFDLAMKLGSVPVYLMPTEQGAVHRPTPVLQPTPIPPSIEEQPWSLSIESAEMEDPVELVSTSLNEQLRNLRDAAIDLSTFRRDVGARWEKLRNEIS